MLLDRILLYRKDRIKQSQKYTSFQTIYGRGLRGISEEIGLVVMSILLVLNNTHLYHVGNGGREHNGYSQADRRCGYLINMAMLHDCER